MRMVTVKVEAIREGEEVLYTAQVDTEQDGSWKEGSKTEYSTESSDGERKFMLEDNQRLVLCGKSNMEMEWDPINFTTRPKKKELKKVEGEEEDGEEQVAQPKSREEAVAPSGAKEAHPRSTQSQRR